MDDRKAILALLTPRAVLRPMTPEAEQAIPDGFNVSGYVVIRQFPFRVGRESRGEVVDGLFIRKERPRSAHAPNNDLYLKDPGPAMHVSRLHFRIERTAGGYQLVDVGSSCGVGVGGARAGSGVARMSLDLNDGDIIAIGTLETPLRYKFIGNLAPDGG
jgi:pSer/pThr/pTyr-binding forkhead associated (FHA) protein